MTTALSVLILLLILGILITVHEWGHFIAARIFGVSVREFAIGMGPVLFKKQGKTKDDKIQGTKFTLRAFPIGGFCDLDEDAKEIDKALVEAAKTGNRETVNPIEPTEHHFLKQAKWKRAVILAAGAGMNVVIGFVFIFVLFLLMIGNEHSIPVVTQIDAKSNCIDILQPGDRLVKINNHKVLTSTGASYFLGRELANGSADLTVLRGGQTLSLGAVKPAEFPVFDKNNDPVLDENGNPKTETRLGIIMGGSESVTFGNAFPNTFLMMADDVRLVWYGILDLVTGHVSAKDMMGPVGMGAVVNQVVSDDTLADEPIGWQIRSKAISLLSLAGLIAVNLAIMNLLPIPALDGGRILFLLISAFLELVRKKPISTRVEGAIHTATFMLLIALMVFVFFNDILRLAT